MHANPDSFSYSLAAVNFFLGCVGVTQLTRIYLYNRSVKDQDLGAVAKGQGKDVKETAEGVLRDPVGAAEKAVK